MTSPISGPTPNWNVVEFQAALYLLKDFLEEQRRLASRGITLETLHGLMAEVNSRQDSLRAIVNNVATQQVSTNLRLDRYGRRIRNLEKFLPESPSGEREFPDREVGEDTGTFRASELRYAEEMMALKIRVEEQAKELERERSFKRDDDTWWKRQRWIWIIAGIMAIFTVLLTSAVTMIVSRVLKP